MTPFPFVMKHGASVCSPHKAYFYFKGNNLVAVRQGDGKLHKMGSGKERKWELYNLKTDIEESQNVYETNRETAEKLIALMNEFDGRMQEN